MFHFRASIVTVVVVITALNMSIKFRPFKHNYYLIKVGFTAVRCMTILTNTHDLCFEEKNLNFSSENFVLLLCIS